MIKNSKIQYSHWHHLFATFLVILFITNVMTGCDSADNIDPKPAKLNGIAVAGAPITGKIYVKGSNGKYEHCVIQDDGSFLVDVSELTGPYVLWSDGKVNDKPAKYYSTRETPGHVNVSPATNLLLAMALQQKPEAYFNTHFTPPSQSTLREAKTTLNSVLGKFYEKADIPVNFDPMIDEFQADKNGFDWILETIDMTINEGAKIVVKPKNSEISLLEQDVETGIVEKIITDTTVLDAIASDNYTPVYKFPDTFLWGTATAAHQVESNNTNNDWYKWEELHRIKDGHSNLTGPDHWNNYDLDFDIAKNQLGTNAYRMSIEWSKIEPTPDTYDQNVIAHYHAMLDAMIQRGIKPVVSVQHFSLPLWIHDPTPDPTNDNKPTHPGWNDDSENPYIVERIVKFTKDMAKEFGSKVDWWITINEPLVMYANGYLVGDFPPGVGYKNEPGALNLPFPMGHHDTIKENLNEAYKSKAYGLKAGIQASKVIFPNIIRAHILMYDAIKEFDKVDADGDEISSMVSISKHHVIFRNIRNDEESNDAFEQMDFLWNKMIWDAIIDGNLDSDLDQVHDEDLTQSYGTFPKVDYIGFNYYARRDIVPVQQISMLMGVQPSEFDFFKGFPVDTSATGALSDLLLGNNYNCLGWEIYPEGMKQIIEFYSNKYGKQHNLPIMITENGTDNDADRPGFVVDMIEQMGQAMQEGHNVIGYLHWSLMDNFEWERGYGQHFGLVRVEFDYETKQVNRELTEGGYAFANIIMNHGVVQALKNKYGTIDNPTNIRDDKSVCSENQGEDPDTGKIKENWETLLDSTKGNVAWSIEKAEDGSISASGEGGYKMNAMGMDVTVLFPFENIPALVSGQSVSYTASGTASIKEMPSMTSGFIYIYDGIHGSYTIEVDNQQWIGMLDSHPIIGQIESTLVKGSGITGGSDSNKWQSLLDTTKGLASWEIINKTEETATVSGEGTYYINALGQNLTISFPFENVTATFTDSSMSFTATGTAVIKEMPTMTSGYTFILNGLDGTYEISVDDAMWAGMLPQHPIVGAAAISPLPDDQGQTVQKGDSSPLASFAINGGMGSVVMKKNGTFSVFNVSNSVLKSQGDQTSNGGVLWRNAAITAQLPLAGIVQGGFLGHEKFTEESDTQAPWISGFKATDFEKTEKGMKVTLSNANDQEHATITIEEHPIDGIQANVFKVTLSALQDVNHISCSFSSDTNERFYGFGSPTWTTQHRGNRIPIWVTEQLLGRETAEDPNNFMELKGHPYDNQIPIPFFMSSKGYGILLDTTYRSLFEMCTEDHPDSWRLETWHHTTSFYIFTGVDFTDLIKTYTALSGRPDMPPDWFFGPMNDAVRGEQNVKRVATLIRDNHIPSSVIWTEDWLGIGSQLTGFRLSHDWDASDIEYPNLSTMIDDLHDDGFKFLGYFSPFIPNPQTTPGHNQEKWTAANTNTYYFLNPEGTMRQMLVPPLIPPAGGGLDLTKPSAVSWYQTYVRQAATIGLDGAMVDFGEWVPFNAVFDDGRTAPEVHNEYPLLWQQANREIWDTLVSEGIKQDYLFYVRSGYTGSQKYATAFWAGDQNTNWDRLDGLASVITMGLNLGLSGIAYFGHDIGGYSSFDTPQLNELPPQYVAKLPANLQSELWDGVSSKELFLRWAALGAYTPMMRTHHGSKYGQNWSFEGGPNPENFTIDEACIYSVSIALSDDTLQSLLSQEARDAIDQVKSVLDNLTHTSYGTWVEIDTAIRNQAGNESINTLNAANLSVAKLILKNAQKNMENLSQPQFDAETLAIWKKMAQQHIALFPYLKTYAKIASEQGIPIMRHMILQYPNDTIIQNGIPDDAAFQQFSGEQSGKRPYNELFQYFLGKELLVAPMIEPEATSRPVYLPEGDWYQIFTRERFSGGKTIIANAAIDEIPVFAKAGSIIPRLANHVETLVETNDPDIMDYKDSANSLNLEIFAGQDGSFQLDDGTEFTYNHNGFIDQTTTATINDITTTVIPLENAIQIVTPRSYDMTIQLSTGASLVIANSPIERSYTVCIVSSVSSDNTAQEVWKTALDGDQGIVDWTAVKIDEQLIRVSGEGQYKISAMESVFTVSFPFTNIPALVANAKMSYTATGTASILELPGMTSDYTFILNSDLDTYYIAVDSLQWQGMLTSHPIIGQSVSSLITGSGITSDNTQKWVSILDTNKGSVTWDADVQSEGTATVIGEGIYYISAMGQNLTISFPFEKVSAICDNSTMSYTATGTATIIEMPSMTSDYSFIINGVNGTYQISVADPIWAGMLEQHPITGMAVITRIDNENPNQGEDIPLITKTLNDNGLQAVINKNGTFALQANEKTILKSKGDQTNNAGLIWRNAKITAQLPLAGTVKGGFLGHEKFSEESELSAPWIAGLKTIDTPSTENGIQAIIATDSEDNQGTITIDNHPLENCNATIIKVTITAPTHANHVSCFFASDATERFYGFGSPTWTTQHRGQRIPIWVTEQLLGRVTTEDPNNFMELKGHPYDNQIPIPFFMSSKGYGILLDTTYRSLFELCTEDHPDTWRLETWHHTTSFYVFTGDNFIDLLNTYSALSGRPEMPPDWFFGPMNDAVRGEQNVQRVSKLIRDHDIPSSVIWTEDWLGLGDQQTGFRLSHDWDASSNEYPNLESMIDGLHADGFKFLGYFSPFIPNPETTPGHNQEKWASANENTYFFLNPEGTMRQMLVPPLIPPAGGGLDLTKSAAVSWYQTYVRQAATLGLDGAMVDFGEWVPFDSVFNDGRTAPEVHNEYPLLWQKANQEIWDTLVNEGIKEDYLFYVRSGYIGSQKFAPAFWAGDQNTNWDRLDGMASVITMGLNLGLSGISYFGHDIGGYSSFDTPLVTDLNPQFASMLPPNLQSELWDGVSSKELFLRWAAIGAYSPMMRTHHGSRYGQNWSFEGGPNPNNFTITSNTEQALNTLVADDTLQSKLPQDAMTALNAVQSVIGSLVGTSYGTWIQIDAAIRNLVGDGPLNTLASANLNIAKYILRYAQANSDNLSHPQYDAETIAIWKKFAQQHIELFPYVKAYAKQSKDHGLPIMRHMILLYPNDETIQKGIPDHPAFQVFSGEQSGKRPYNELFQYFFGNELLVAPIIDPGETSRPVYLPEGTWYNISTREQFSGPQTIIAKAELDDIPIFSKQGSIIPRLEEGVETLVNTNDPDIIDYDDIKSTLRVEIFSGSDGSFKMADGTELTYSHQGIIDNTTTAILNDVSINVMILDHALYIETPLSGDIDLVLSNGSRLEIKQAPIVRSYKITIVASTIPSQVTHRPILDSKGREIILRGVNARIEGVFDVTFDDGREPLEPIPSFSKDDTDAMQKIGFNFLRLPINWSAIEPSPDTYSDDYINRIQQIVDLCHQANIQVMLDMHQDAFSKEIGEDGAALWAIIPAPENVNAGGHLDNLVSLRFSPQVQKAFKSFWQNVKVASTNKGLQDHFIGAMTYVMTHFKDHAAVLGMEIFNEPWLLHTDLNEKDISLLHNFYNNAITQLQAIAPNKKICFEPDVSKNYPAADGRPQYSGIIPDTIPWDTTNTVYAPHLYVKGFIMTGDPDPNDPEIIVSIMNSLVEANAFKAPLIIGEFGFNHKDPDYAATIDRIFNLADQHLFHTAQWVWKENSQDAWGFYDFTQEGVPEIRETIAQDTARAYPQAISGRIKTIQYNRDTFELMVQFTYKHTGEPHVLFLPITYAYTNGYEVSCNDTIVNSVPLNEFGSISVTCGQEEDATYTLRVIAK